MAGWGELARKYEARHFPPTRQLDVHGEGPVSARERALRWIQSHAHETPGEELLLIVERGGRPGRAPGPVRLSVERMLRELEGRLVEWWQPFGPGSIALRLSPTPNMLPTPAAEPPPDPTEGRTPETAAGYLAPEHDIPPELYPLARQAAELRRAREGLSLGIGEVLLQRVWIEAQAIAMEEAISFAEGLQRVLELERRRALEAEEEDWGR